MGGVNLPSGAILGHSARCHHMGHEAFVAEAAELVAYGQHTSAYVSIREHTSAYVSICEHGERRGAQQARLNRPVDSIRQHSSAYAVYVSILSAYFKLRSLKEAGRQHTSAYVSIRQHTQYTSAYAASVSIRQHRSIRQHALHPSA